MKIIDDKPIEKTYKVIIDTQKGKYFLKFDCDVFEIEITKEQFREIDDDIRFKNKVESEGGAICYTPLAERIRAEYIMENLLNCPKIKSRLKEENQKVVIAAIPPKTNFYDFWKSTKPLLEQEPQYVVFYDTIHYKKLKPRKRRNQNKR